MFGHAHKNTTSSYLQPDIRDLQRKGFMRPRGRQMLNWSRAGEVIASLSLRADFDRIVLRYRHQRYGEVWKAEEYPVFLDSTPCHYGNSRFGFSAPAWDVRAVWPSSMGVQSSPVGIVTDSFTRANVRQITVAR